MGGNRTREDSPWELYSNHGREAIVGQPSPATSAAFGAVDNRFDPDTIVLSPSAESRKRGHDAESFARDAQSQDSRPSGRLGSGKPLP